MLISTALIGGLLGGFCKMMLKNSATIIDFITTYLNNKQQIKLAEIQAKNPTQNFQSFSCAQECKFDISDIKNVQIQHRNEPKIFKMLRAMLIASISLILIIYLIVDFTTLQTNYSTLSEIKEILEGYRHTALGLLMFIVTWALTGNADNQIYNNIKTK